MSRPAEFRLHGNVSAKRSQGSGHWKFSPIQARLFLPFEGPGGGL